jgi:hypothetical protein
MQPKIESKQLVTIAPVQNGDEVQAGDVVLCKVNGRDFLHQVKIVRRERGNHRFQIGNMKGFINGWVGLNSIFGRLVKVEP